MGDFKISYGKTSKTEGAYSNVAGDTGGRTYCGISQIKHPNWPGWPKIMLWISQHGEPARGHVFKDIPGLDDDVLAFYKSQEWDELRLDEVNAQDWCDTLYDTAVNQGAVTAIHYAQDTFSLSHTPVMDDLTIQTINAN